jgi:UDP-GlcNAc:undecaprenyl-phosphate GlcNAc-1-phosphate transferase
MTADKSHVHHFLMRSGLKHNEVALILGGIQIVLISLVFLLGDYSDNLILPILSIVVLILGFRLDKLTLRLVKKNALKSPKILEMRTLTVPQKQRIKLERNTLNPDKINLN